MRKGKLYMVLARELPTDRYLCSFCGNQWDDKGMYTDHTPVTHTMECPGCFAKSLPPDYSYGKEE